MTIRLVRLIPAKVVVDVPKRFKLIKVKKSKKAKKPVFICIRRDIFFI